MGTDRSMNRLTAAQPDQATARSFWTMGRSDSERAFRSARRHSRFVRITRVAIPVLLLLALGATVLWNMFNPLRLIAKLPDSISGVVVSGTTITMEAPHLSGYTRDARSYELGAASASQDITHPDLVGLREIRAKFQMDDDNTAQMTADDGVYDSKREVLTLGKSIVISSTSGYRAWLSDAEVDVRTSDVVSDKPVEVRMLRGTLNASRFEVRESGAVLKFGGRVRMTVLLSEEALAAAAAADRARTPQGPSR